MKTLNSTAEKIKTTAGSAAIVVQSADAISEISMKIIYGMVGTHFKAADALINNAATLSNENTGDVGPALWWRGSVAISPNGVYGNISGIYYNGKESNVKAPYLLSHYSIKQFVGKATTITLTSS